MEKPPTAKFTMQCDFRGSSSWAGRKGKEDAKAKAALSVVSISSCVHAAHSSRTKFCFDAFVRNACVCDADGVVIDVLSTETDINYHR